MFELTAEQREILEYRGDLLVLAGPGTGKTFTLLYKIKHLLEMGVPQEKIFLLTFSLKICQELKEKLNSLGIKEIKVDTFHGLAYDLYREYFQKEPVLISETEREHLLKKLSLKKKDLSLSLNQKKYYAYLERLNLLDFDLLLLKVASLKFRNFKDYYLIIDEFQDLSPEILEFLTLFKEATFFLFGDPHQSIYGFRGVKLEAIKSFLEAYKPHIKILSLTQSFRCPQEILEAASSFKSSPWETLSFKSLIKGGTIQGFVFPNATKEKDFLLPWVSNLLGGITLERASMKGLPPSEIFILSRIKKIFEPLKDFLQKEGIPVAMPEEEAQLLKEKLLLLAEKVKYQKQPLEKLIAELSPFLKNLVLNWYELFSRDKAKITAFMQALSPYELIFPSIEGINFLTIHASKGLEAKVVILYGAEEDLIPLKIFKDSDFEEEKRLLYVAMTRSKKEFYFIANKERKIFNISLNKGLSSWLKIFPFKTFSPLPPKPKQKGLF